jgi:CheY-like chemotaxis protein
LVLTQAGASVKAVASVREALHVLEVERPHALVSDIDLSDQDGYALIRQIRQYEVEHGGFLPAVALTGYARAEDRARALAAGFQVHAPKPVEPATLTAAIAAMTDHLATTNANSQHAAAGQLGGGHGALSFCASSRTECMNAPYGFMIL